MPPISGDNRVPFRYYKTPTITHPTRNEPETLKNGSADLSLFKTLCRVVRYAGEVDLTLEECVAAAEQIMPWIRRHLTKHRPEINTHKKMNKALKDMACAVNKTMNKYRPGYVGSGLTELKRKEILVARRLLARGVAVNEGDAEVLVRAAGGARGNHP